MPPRKKEKKLQNEKIDPIFDKGIYEDPRHLSDEM